MPPAATGSSPRSSPRHIPVLVREVLGYLDPQPGQTIVDGTVGAGGHAEKILPHLGRSGRLIGLDRDAEMLRLAESRLRSPQVVLRQASYAELDSVLAELGIDQVDGILLDLGLSSDQLANASRGFSFTSDAPLDLRFDPQKGEPAWRLLEHLDEAELAELLRRYGEEPWARRIARRIVQRRNTAPIRTARELAELCARVVPASARRRGHHPATRTFQALRIAVNDELEHLERALETVLYQSLRQGGRLVIISFHSLEDRLVKRAFQDQSRWQILTPKPVTASAAERRMNPRSRTAKLRAATKS